MPGMTHRGGISHHGKNWHVNDVDCDSILSHDCNDDEDTSKRLM